MSILEPYSTVSLIDESSLSPLREALQRYCLSLTRSLADAEDLAQDTWTKALAYGKFAAAPNPEALLLRIAKNTWIDAVRRKTSLVRVLERSLASSGPNSGHAPENSLTEIELAFQALIRHLSPLQRTVFLMRDVLGYPASEAAEMLGTTEGAVKAALHRARYALEAVRRELTDHEGPALPQDMDFRILLRALAASYEKGQLPVMLELLRQETAAEMTMAVSSSTVQGYFGGISTNANSATGTMTQLRMAA
ncbi:RNA polymerase sigma factor [Paenibacillus sp. BAC0078]